MRIAAAGDWWFSNCPNARTMHPVQPSCALYKSLLQLLRHVHLLNYVGADKLIMVVIAGIYQIPLDVVIMSAMDTHVCWPLIH